MKCILFILVLTSVMFSAELAHSSSHLGMYTDESTAQCDMPLQLYFSRHIYFFVDMAPYDLTRLHSAQFKLENPLIHEVNALIIHHWAADQVIGDWSTDITLGFDPAVQGPCVFLGSVEIFPFVDVGNNHTMSIVPADGQSAIWLVNEDTGQAVASLGGEFTFNCTGVCYCRQIQYCNTPAETASFSCIKALY